MDSGVLKIENGSGDRRKASIPVENDRRCGVDRRTAPRSEHHHSKLSYAFKALSPVRRFEGVKKDIEEGEIGAACGLATLALINLPSDFDDIKESVKQVKSWFGGPKFEHSYNHKELQHPFSFFRNTLLDKPIKYLRKTHAGLTEKILNLDKTAARTKFGTKILNLFNTKPAKLIPTMIKDIDYSELNPELVHAREYVGTKFGKLTARAMERTTVLGLAVLAACELPKIYHALKKGNGMVEKAENTAKQTVKSGINLASLTAGIAYGGAIGSKYLGNFGSLVGMGIGALAGSFVSGKIQNINND